MLVPVASKNGVRAPPVAQQDYHGGVVGADRHPQLLEDPLQDIPAGPPETWVQ